MRRLSVLLVLHVLAATVHAQHAPSSLMTAIQAYAGKKGHQERPPFRHALTDLNSDGQADAIVLLLGSSWCGSGGCNMLVFRGTQDGFTLVSASTIANEPIRVLPENTQGWKSLIVYSKGRGHVLMQFNGTRYPLNPSLQSKATTAQVEAAEVLLK
jgi:hypothetical protein